MLEHRQGDVALVRVDAKPDGAALVEREADEAIVLAEGEVTGHAHVIQDPTVTLWEAKGGKRYVEVPQGAVATLTHEEHAAQTIQPGVYEVRRQREWTDEDEPRQVAD